MPSHVISATLTPGGERRARMTGEALAADEVAAVLPVLLLVPKRMIATRDGEALEIDG